MELQFVYQKKRSDFGRQCLFSDKGPDLIDNYASNKELLNDYIIRDPVSQGTQCGSIQAQHDINTTRAIFSNTGVNHTEGGWPKDVNIHDEEHTKRYRRKVEKEDNFNPCVMSLFKNMEKCIFQNNAINIYEQYYSDMDILPMVERSSARTVNVYQDPCPTKRAINHISWSPDNGTKLAITHCNYVFPNIFTPEMTHSYIWEVENPNRPLLTFKPVDPSSRLEYHQKDSNILVSGQMNGLLNVWDVRRGPYPVEISPIEVSHRDPVCGVLWINSKSGTEFFSASSGGQVKWWDTRRMNQLLENLILSPSGQVIEKAMSASCIEYEPTMPMRFMVGTEQGVIISCNRKGKTPSEKMPMKFQAHLGPVLALNRNAAFAKNFLSVGDWTVRIWSEDCRESHIMWTGYHKPMLTGGAWSPTRYSVFFTTRTDGTLDVWDILQQQRQACMGIKVCDEPLKCLRTHDMGRLVAVGNLKGTTYLVQVSENLATCNKNDKMLLTAMFERESHREKILEARNRELRLKMSQKAKGSATAVAVTESGTEIVPEGAAEELDETGFYADPNVVQAETEFYQYVNEQLGTGTKNN